MDITMQKITDAATADRGVKLPADEVDHLVGNLIELTSMIEQARDASLFLKAGLDEVIKEMPAEVPIKPATDKLAGGRKGIDPPPWWKNAKEIDPSRLEKRIDPSSTQE